jgi:quercetin dioxygenase-like cupin family protein
MSNKIVHVPAGSGEAYWMMGDLFIYLVTGTETGGAYFSLQVNVGPGNGPPPHIHHLEDEQFYILEGQLAFQVGGQAILASAGDFLHIPRGIVHSFKNGASPARLFSTFTPAGIEGFFRAVGDPAEDRSVPVPVTGATIARLTAAEAAGWKDHHDTLPLPR